MEYSCYRCGARVEEGVNFCPSCGAPQIRVAPRAAVEAEPQPLPAVEPQGASAQVTASATQGQTLGWSAPASTLTVSEHFDWPQALPSAALGGVCGAVLALLPFLSVVFPLWMAAAGVFAVAFYRRRRRVAWVPAGAGARLGALAGAIGFFPFAVVVALEFLFLSRSGMMKEVFDRVNTSSADPQVQQQMQQFIAWLQTPQGAAFAVVAVLVFCFLLFLVLATIGGAMWASLTGKKGSQSA